MRISVGFDEAHSPSYTNLTSAQLIIKLQPAKASMRQGMPSVKARVSSAGDIDYAPASPTNRAPKAKILTFDLPSVIAHTTCASRVSMSDFTALVASMLRTTSVGALLGITHAARPVKLVVGRIYTKNSR